MASNTYGKKAQIFSAFRLHGDGHGRFIIRHNGLSLAELGQLNRRLTDLETYRLLALISLPMAKKIGPELLEMDRKLADILTVVTDLDTDRSEREHLEILTGVQARLEAYRTETNHRFFRQPGLLSTGQRPAGGPEGRAPGRLFIHWRVHQSTAQPSHADLRSGPTLDGRPVQTN